MSTSETVKALGEKLRPLPSEALCGVVLFLVKPAVQYWAAEATKHHRVMSQFPATTTMHAAASRHYEMAFAHHHRLAMLSKAIEEIRAARPYGGRQAKAA